VRGRGKPLCGPYSPPLHVGVHLIHLPGMSDTGWILVDGMALVSLAGEAGPGACAARMQESARGAHARERARRACKRARSARSLASIRGAAMRPRAQLCGVRAMAWLLHHSGRAGRV
jgi:hypothetical protein